MASQAKKTSQLPTSNGLVANDLGVVCVANIGGIQNTAIITPGKLFGNSAVPYVSVGNNAVQTANLVLTSNVTPANSTAATVTQGQMWSDGSYIYFADANNHVKRAALSSF